MAIALATARCDPRSPQRQGDPEGKLRDGAAAKDIILVMLGIYGESSLAYKSLEIEGPGLKTLSVDERMTICNMASEMGIKAVVMRVDEISHDYVVKRTKKPFEAVWADEDATYDEVRELDLRP
jgi:3-isopropylmalate/(R)-2-methylmalate dehydratase large subunit